jgi:hypothetical protein
MAVLLSLDNEELAKTYDEISDLQFNNGKILEGTRKLDNPGFVMPLPTAAPQGVEYHGAAITGHGSARIYHGIQGLA